MNNFLQNLRLNNYFLDGVKFYDLVSMLVAVGAMGEGAIAESNGALEGELNLALSRTLANPDSTHDELVAAVLAAEVGELEIPDFFDVSTLKEGSS